MLFSISLAELRATGRAHLCHEHFDVPFNFCVGAFVALGLALGVGRLDVRLLASIFDEGHELVGG